MVQKCARCGKDAGAYTMSRFNTEMCCFDCIDKEKRHLKYEEAEAAEQAAVDRGDFNFPGIGKPEDL